MLPHLDAARQLMREYAQLPHVEGRWLNVDAEIDGLPGVMRPPFGALLLAMDDTGPLGIVGMRPVGRPGRAVAGDGGIDGDAEPMVEMKRLYVPVAARGRGVGEALVRALLATAARAGYRRMVLDTTPDLVAAQDLYRRLGFEPVARYLSNHYADALCFGRAIDTP